MARGKDQAAADGVIGIEEIMRLIPHRPPFLMVDRAEGYQPGKSLVGVKCVGVNEPYLEVRFADPSVLPPVILIEILAQTGSVLMAKTWGEDSKDNIVLFLSVDNCRFLHPVRPGDVVRGAVVVTRTRGSIARLHGKVTVGRKLVAEADVAAMMVDTRKAEAPPSAPAS